MSPRRYVVLAKIETTQFTDATPDAATDAMLVKNVNITPLRVETEDRNLDRAYFGNSEKIAVLTEGVLEFDVEMAGSGAAGTAPGWGVLLRACAFAETITASTSAAYNPISDSFESATIYCYRDGVLYKFLGAQGNVAINMAAKTIPHFHFRFVGQYSAVTDASLPASPDYSIFQQPKGSIPANTGTLTWNSYAAKVSAFSTDMQNQVSHAVWMNQETLAVTDRKPQGSITVEAVLVATHNYFSELLNGTLGAYTITHGTTAGNKVKVDQPKMQLADMRETTFENTLAYQFTTTANPNAGNDEVVITAL